MKVYLSKFWDTRGSPALPMCPCLCPAYTWKSPGELKNHQCTHFMVLARYLYNKDKVLPGDLGVSMSLDDSVMQYNVRTTGLRLVTFWSHWREDVIHAPVESQAGWTRRWTTRRSIGGDPALPSLGITSEPVPLDKNGWYRKPSQHLGASEVTDLRKEATITTLLDEHVLAHPKSYP